MNQITQSSSEATVRVTAVNAPTQFVESRGRRLAYRSIGKGQPIVLCVRFRGVMDSWDPAFLDALADRGFRVVVFDYSGLGRSSGTPDYNPVSLAGDANDLMEALDLRGVVLGGWSLGGIAAQLVLALHPERIARLLLIGTTPPGPIVKMAEQLFYDTALKPIYGLKEELILFFEPKSEASRKAGAASVARIAARTADRSPPVPIDFAAAFAGNGPKEQPFPADAVLELLKSTSVPILHIGGDHDIIFPVENWYALNHTLPTLHLVTYPSAGHGPQHQHPEASAEHIAAFCRLT
jgi:pimeloyl-ACP methyl ester carboxylesterase